MNSNFRFLLVEPCLQLRGLGRTAVELTSIKVTLLLFSEAVNSLLKAIEIYTDMGKFTMAAKHHQAIAEIYETEVSSAN